MCVDILLASFNGEQYIEAQILSIISQSFKDWNLIIHDDGSDDNTIAIIKNMIKKDNRIKLIEDGVRCGTAADNFMHLLKYSVSPYCMFCDQDDIWFDNKIEVMLTAMKKYSEDIPLVVYSNSYVWNPNSGITGKATCTYPENVRQFLFLNSGMQGCVSIFNRRMKEHLLDWKYSCVMHDHLLHLFGLTLGKVEYLNLPLMLYRQHDHNVTGYTAVTKNDFKRIFFNSTLPVVCRKHYDVIENFYDTYLHKISSSDAKLMNDFLLFPSMSKIRILLKVIFDRFQLFDSTLRLVLKILIRSYIN
ncbi:glycosyltransferase family 2 protein [Phocaeicola sp.]|uniref:glycosyltransferase family 2 protein n=1 Tax=Phocaeicola sp. TaxID=2773926 RepID=UPI0023BDA68D|nr:glycosyltransferase family 2 protein [Phocaeicola sp.]MDE5676246.1 glycosyltransferase family 2 protein [Phocaeicola sp.]